MLIAVSALAIFTAFQYLFSTFVGYDDEGYILLSLQSYLSGHPLYDETYSQYGPVFYQIFGAINAFLEVPLTNTFARYHALFAWCGVAFLAGLIVWEFSNRRLFAVAVGLLVFHQLTPLALEPGHPHGICTLLLYFGIYLCCRCGQSLRNSTSLLLLSITTGLLVGIKLNIGALLGIAVAYGAAYSLHFTGFLAFLRRIAKPALMLVPFLLFAPRIHLEPTLTHALFISTGLFFIFGLNASDEEPGSRPISIAQLLQFIAMSSIVVIASLGFALLSGSTVHGLLYGLVLQHKDLVTEFYKAPHFPIPATLAIPAVYLIFKHREEIGIKRLKGLAAVVLLLVPAIFYIFNSTTPLIGDRTIELQFSSFLALAGCSLSWILLLNGEDTPPTQRFARLVLSLTAILQTITIFPISGTQLSLAASYSILVGAICFLDLLENKRSATASLSQSSITFFILLLALSALVLRAAYQRSHYLAGRPLGFSGAETLRLPEPLYDQYHWIKKELQAHSDGFLFFPIHKGSMNLWTHIPPLTHHSVTGWPLVWTDDQQQSVIDALEKRHHPVIIWNDPSPFEERVKNKPLVKYIRGKFTKELARYPLIRNEDERVDIVLLVPATESEEKHD